MKIIMHQILLFPFAAILISVISYFYPEILNSYVDAIVPLLSIVMFSMGMSLQIEDFKQVLKKPVVIIFGLFMQFGFMPLFAWLISLSFGLPELLLIGMVLVGTCPGGTASNIICYLAKGNVALSISLTTISTMLAVVMTPLLTYLYLHQSIDVPTLKMMKSLFMIILFPILLGVLINKFFQAYLSKVIKALPVVSMLSVVFIIGIIVAKGQTAIDSTSMIIIIAVILHNLTGFGMAYFLIKLFKNDEVTARTLAIEVGMQNSGLAIELSRSYFSILSALPAVLFSVWHNISGAIIAAVWSRQTKQENK